MTADDSKREVKYSVNVKFEPILAEGGKPAVQVSGPRTDELETNITVLGSLSPLGVGEARMNVFESIFSLTVNVNALLTIN